MSEILFSCECGMTIKVKGGEATGGMVECPSCDASIPVPTFEEAAARSSDPAPEPDEEDVPGSGLL